MQIFRKNCVIFFRPSYMHPIWILYGCPVEGWFCKGKENVVFSLDTKIRFATKIRSTYKNNFDSQYSQYLDRYAHLEVLEVLEGR